MASTNCNVVVLISGSGSNLQALIDASANSNFDISAVISNKADAFGLQRASNAAIQTELVDHKVYPDRNSFDLALAETIDRYSPDLVVLAGFMRILGGEFVSHYLGRIINIHPSLLPKYPGINTHQRVIEAGDSEHGVSVHFVTEELDGGPVIAQEIVSVAGDNSADSLAAKVLAREHVIYPKVVSWFAADRLQLKNNKAFFDGQELPVSGVGAGT